MMDRTRYIVIQEWMLNLGLHGSELIAYALIFGYCQDGESDFHGSAQYVATWCGVRREQAQRILQKLTEGGYIVKTGGEAGYPVHYSLPGEGCAIIGGVRLSHTGCAVSASLSPHTPYTLDNKDINIDKNTLSAGAREDKFPFGEMVRMTTDEHGKLVQRFGSADAARLCEILDDYLVNHPRKRYVSHYRAILSWCVTRLQEEKLTQQRMKNAREAGLRAAGQPVRTTNYAALAEADARRKAIEDKYKDK